MEKVFNYLLIIAITASLAKQSAAQYNCSRYALPTRNPFRQHIDYYRQNRTSYPTRMDTGLLISLIMETIFSSDIHGKPKTIRFITALFEPFVFSTSDGDGFTVWGPIYSLVKELAIYLNYRYCVIHLLKCVILSKLYILIVLSN